MNCNLGRDARNGGLPLASFLAALGLIVTAGTATASVLPPALAPLIGSAEATFADSWDGILPLPVSQNLPSNPLPLKAAIEERYGSASAQLTGGIDPSVVTSAVAGGCRLFCQAGGSATFVYQLEVRGAPGAPTAMLDMYGAVYAVSSAPYVEPNPGLPDYTTHEESDGTAVLGISLPYGELVWNESNGVQQYGYLNPYGGGYVAKLPGAPADTVYGYLPNGRVTASLVIPVNTPITISMQSYGDVFCGVGTFGYCKADGPVTMQGEVDPTFSFAPGSGTGDSLIFSPGLGGVPEPATWTLTILGVAMVGSAIRRRRGLKAFAG